MTDLRALWDHVKSVIQEAAPEDVAYFRNLPRPGEISDQFFLTELAWVVYNAGFRETTLRAKWPALRQEFLEFDPPRLATAPRYVTILGVRRVFNHFRKARAVMDAARKVVADGPMGAKLAAMSTEETLTYLQIYPFIGPVTRYHLARNIGLDVVKPDRHLVRLAAFCGYETPAELVAEIAAFAGERVGVIDYILWQWLAAMGDLAYEVAAKLLFGASGTGAPR